MKTVKRLTGIADESRIVKNETGWCARTYIIDGGKIVLKFPRNKEEQRAFAYEVAALKLIGQHEFNVAVPKVNWVAENNEHIGFFGVIGNPVTADTLADLTDAEKTQIGAQIGIFLKTLHGVYADYDDIYKMSIADEIKEAQQKYLEAKSTLKKHFTSNELKIIHGLFMFEMPKRITELGQELVFCHGDLTDNNILLNGAKVGIIDFGDAGLYDKSKELCRHYFTPYFINTAL